MSARVYIHVDPTKMADVDGRPVRVWHVGSGMVWEATRVEIDGPCVVVHDPAGRVDPEGRHFRVWVETAAAIAVDPA